MKKYKSIFKENKKDLGLIGNLEDLPKGTQKFLYREVDKLSPIGHQEYTGYIGRQAVISMQGYWHGDDEDARFYIKSYGMGKGGHPVFKNYNMPLQWKNKRVMRH